MSYPVPTQQVSDGCDLRVIVEICENKRRRRPEQ